MLATCAEATDSSRQLDPRQERPQNNLLDKIWMSKQLRPEKRAMAGCGEKKGIRKALCRARQHSQDQQHVARAVSRTKQQLFPPMAVKRFFLRDLLWVTLGPFDSQWFRFRAPRRMGHR